MKKILITTILLGFIIFLGACNPTNGGDDRPPLYQLLEPASDAKVPYLEDNYVCVWGDEFDGTEVDSKKWSFQNGGDGGGNGESQYYRQENASVDNGILTITAKKEIYQNKAYTSSRLNSKWKGEFRYGRFQASLKVPTGRGTWPAFWMMPVGNKYGVWPNSGEIDIMEHVGYDPTKVHGTVHSARKNHNSGGGLGKSYDLPTATTQFHLYELIWEPGLLIWLVDGNEFFRTTYQPGFNLGYAYNEVFPFDQEFYIILNLAIGGNWGAAQGIDPNLTEAKYEIDYVRVYQKNYSAFDDVPPSSPLDIKLATLKNTIYWTQSVDDGAILRYDIYVDGKLHDECNLNQYTFKKLTKGTYDITIIAVDFVGRESESSPSFRITIT